ncbi:FAD-dependent oxidoreductase [Bacillus sp. NPDC077027]|uniref:FAD-dependent oxidoreductase n=1 Tax=Bacillus sp. NPDC077027 TaxID=3390548 RepID=UPI003D068F2B
MTNMMKRHRAIVIGAGIAGMFTAKVLSNFYQEIYIIERDELPAHPSNRAGTPQAFHPHRVLPLGKKIIEQLFPGYTEELLKMGGFNTKHQTSRFITKDGELHMTDTEETAVTRRALLEWVISQRLLALPHVQFLTKHEAVSLLFGEDDLRVNGLLVKDRHHQPAKLKTLKADLVVDTSGRMSKLQKWLLERGLELPKPEILKVSLGYSTRYYQIPPNARKTQAMVVLGQPDKQIPTGLFELIDHNMAVVLLSAAGGTHYPTTEDDKFEQEIATLSHPAIAEAISHLIPCTPPKGFRVQFCMRQHYEQMPKWPSGLLVMGDAFCTLDPIHGQGMTKAALEAHTLEQMLKKSLKEPIENFEPTVMRHMQKAIEPGWWLCAIADLQWNGVELTAHHPIPHIEFVQEYLNRYVQHAILTNQPKLLEAYHSMHSFLKEPKEIINLEHLHDMIKRDETGDTKQWWEAWKQKSKKTEEELIDEAVPDFQLKKIIKTYT